MNREWKHEWGGETILLGDDAQEIEYCCPYKPGRIIIFDSTIPHSARQQSFATPCTDLRWQSSSMLEEFLEWFEGDYNNWGQASSWPSYYAHVLLTHERTEGNKFLSTPEI